MKEVIFIQQWKYKGYIYERGDKTFLSEKKANSLKAHNIVKFATIKKKSNIKTNKNGSNNP
jgi:hypothetical protein